MCYLKIVVGKNCPWLGDWNNATVLLTVQLGHSFPRKTLPAEGKMGKMEGGQIKLDGLVGEKERMKQKKGEAMGVFREI